MKRLQYIVAAATMVAPSVLGAVNVGATSLSELSDSYEAASTVLTLKSDITDCIVVGAGENYTIDLNGKTITNGDAGCAAIVNNGTLTITGSGNMVQAEDSYAPLVVNHGTLTIESGTYTGAASLSDYNGSGASYAPVIHNAEGETTIEGGTFTANNTTASRWSAVVIGQAGTTTINDGTFTQNGAYNAIASDGDGEVIINGGTFTNNAGKWAGVIGNIEGTNGTVTITGGTVNAYNNGWAIIDFENADMEVTGGTFNGVVGAYDGAFITGGTFSENPEEATYWDGEAFQAVSAVKSGYVALEGDGGYTIETFDAEDSEITLARGETQELEAAILPEGYENATVTYVSANTDLVTVTQDTETGVWTATATDKVSASDESTTIAVTAVANGKTEEATITVKVPANFTGIEAEISEDEIEFDETATITTTIGGGISADDVTISYDISEKIVEVDEDGVVSVVDDFVSDKDVDVEITVKATVGEGDDALEATDTVKLTVLANFTEVTATASADTISAGEIVRITADTDYEGTQRVHYSYEASEDGILMINPFNGWVMVNPSYLATEDTVVMVKVKATVGDVTKEVEWPLLVTVEPTFTGISAHLTTDAIYPGGFAFAFATPEGGYMGALDYEYEVISDNWYLVNLQDNRFGSIINAMPGQVWTGVNPEDQEVVIRVSAEIDGEVYYDDVTLTIKSNLYEILSGNNQTYYHGSEGGLTTRIDGEYDDFQYVEVYSEEFMALLASDAMNEMSDEEWDAAVAAGFFELEEGVDYTLEEGSTIITFTDEFLDSLENGNYIFVAAWEEGAWPFTVDRRAQGEFTIADPEVIVVTPETGAYTRAADGVTASALATAGVLTAGAALVLAAKRYAKSARK